MPPHLFHTLSDDPARWERQFGCMAAFFHMLHGHQPRFFRKRSSCSAAEACSSGHSHSQSTNINKPVGSAKAWRPSKNDDHMGTARVKPAPAKKRCSETRSVGSPDQVTHKLGTTTCDFSAPDYTLVEAMAPYSYKVPYKQYPKKESPSILDSSKATNYTIREPPRMSFEAGVQSPDHQCCSCSTPPADSSRSLPGSPLVGFSKTRNHRSQFVAKSLFDKPRVSLDYDRHEGQLAAPRPHISQINDELSYSEACKDPLEQLKESLRALAKLQQTTQQFVDGVEAQKQPEKAAKKTSTSSSTWWSARKARSSKNRHASQTMSMVEGPVLEARTSSFDYTEAIRISQKLEDTPARLSLDGRELVPKVVLKLREAMRLGIVNGDIQGKYSSSDDQEKRIDSASLRSALLASKEEGKGKSGNAAKSVADRGGQCSNVIARLMGLHDLPARPMHRDGSMESKHPRNLHPTAEYCSSAKDESTDCITGALEQTRSVYGAPDQASKLMKREAFVHKERKAQALHKDPLLTHREDDCKVIREVQLPMGPRASSHCPARKDNGPAAANMPRHAKMESQFLKLLHTRAGDRSGRALDCAKDSEKTSAIVVQELRFKDKQEHVQEFEQGRRQVKTSSNVAEVQRNSVDLSMELRGLLHPQNQKLQVASPGNNKADAASSASSSSPSRQRDIISHYRSDKRNLGEHDKKEPVTKHLQPHLRKGVEAGDQTPKLATKPAASHTVTRMMSTRDIEKESLRQHLHRAAAAAPKVSTAAARDHHMRVMINQVAACEEYKKKVSSNRKMGSLDSTKRAVTKVSEMCAEESAEPRAKLAGGAGAAAGSKVSKMSSRNGDKLVARRRAAAGRPILEHIDARKSPSSYGSCTRALQAETTNRAASSYMTSSTRAILASSTSCHDALTRFSQDIEYTDHDQDLQPGMRSLTCHPPALPLYSDASTSETSAGTSIPAVRDVVLLPISTLEGPPHADRDNADVTAGEVGQFEYVEAILERAGLLDDKEDALERQRRLGAWVTSADCAPEATFLEIEHSCSTLTSAFGSRHQRRLIFDCVHHILAVKSAADGCKRGLLSDVWKELKRQLAAVETGLHLSTSSSQRVRLLIKRDMDELERSQEVCWTQFSYFLEDAIFQDLLQELMA